MTYSAVEAIRTASLGASGVGKETGGIIIGPVPTNGLVMIASATGPGPDDSNASYASWETDPEYLNQMLRMAREENPGVNLRGFWHLHPGQMTWPSGQDLREARNILEDTQHYKLNGELIMPIVTARDGRIIIRCYYISDGDRDFREIPMEIIADTDAMESHGSEKEVTEVDMEAKAGFWEDADWQFHGTVYGAGRLGAELDELKNAGYDVTARLVDDGNCCIEVSGDGGDRKALFLLPREYPLNPPRVFMKSGERILEVRVSVCSPLYRWSGGFRLSELMGGKLGEQLRIDSHLRNSLSGIFAHVREDFRHGMLDIFGTMRKLVGLMKPERRGRNAGRDTTGDSGRDYGGVAGGM